MDKPLSLAARAILWFVAVNALIGAGLSIEALNEHERLAWKFAPIMVPVDGRRRMWVLPEGFPKLPLAYSIWARKK